ncbi:MAG: adenylate/guanylate cyclase domain-containing protein [Pseudomonadota bacterium]
MSFASTFEEHFAREILQSERTRMAVLAGVLAALLVAFALLFAAFQEEYSRHITRRAVFVQVAAAMLLLLVYELAVRYVIGRRLREGKKVADALRYVNAFVETSFPSVLMLLVARATDPVYVLQSAAPLLYGIFIVLSTLRLDFRLPVFTGAVAAAEYLALYAFYFGAGGERIAATPFETPPFHLAKVAALLASGFAAGFVGHQLKRRAGNAFRAQEERQRIVSAFGQQVSPAIAEELLKRGTGLESRRAYVCIMFMDIRDFTPTVERMPPEQIVAFQNAVFGEAIEAVNRHRGVINQFLGDGFMATFGAPLPTGEDCRNALAAARELVERVAALCASGRIPPTRIGIGLHAGEAVSGNIGTEQRRQYSITGNVVILAARIEQLNKTYGSQLLVSAEVVREAGDLARDAVAVGPVQVKGRNEPIEIYRLA